MQPPSVSISRAVVTTAAFVVVIAGVKAASSLLVPLLLAAFIAIIMAPYMFWMQKKGLPSGLAIFSVILLVLMCILLVSGLIGTSMGDFKKNLPEFQKQLDGLLATVTAWLEVLEIDAESLDLSDVLNPGSAMRLVAAGLSGFQSVLTNGFLLLMTVAFMLMEASSLPSKLKAIIGNQEGSLGTFDRFLADVKQYMVLKTLISLATGVIVAVFLYITGVSYPLLWGLLAFMLNYIPNIGSIFAAIPPVLLGLIQLGLMKAAIVAAGFVVINTVMGSIIEPRFMGRGVGLSTLVVFISLLFWGWVLGPVGMILSVPLTIMVKIALDSNEDSRWLAVLLGPDISPRKTGKKVPITGEADET